MNPVYYRVNQAIYYTCVYYEMERIAPHMARIAGKSSNSSSELLDAYYEETMASHERMEDEIKQNIYITVRNAQVDFFEWLKEWLTDVRIQSLNRAWIIRAIEGYNERVYAKFLADLEKKEAEFKSTDKYNSLKHLDEYETPAPTAFQVLLGGLGTLSYENGKATYYRFLCITEGPELIDTDRTYLSEYFDFVNGIITNFRRIVSKYVDRFDAGGITAPGEQILVIKGDEPRLIEAEKPDHTKINVNLSVKQLTYLFRLLYDVRPEIFNVKTQTELYQFIAQNFTTKATKGKALSLDNIKNTFEGPEKNVADFWVAILQKMLVQSKNL